MQEAWLLLLFVVCVSHSDIKIMLLEITHLAFVIQDKARKTSRSVLLPSLFNPGYLKIIVSTESRFLLTFKHFPVKDVL